MPAAAPLERADVFGFPVVAGTMNHLIAHLIARAETLDRPTLIAAADAHVVTRGVRQQQYGNHLDTFDIICPDGMPVVWKLKRQPTRNAPHRLSGPDIMSELWDKGQPSPHIRHYLLGGSEQTLATLREKLLARYPGAQLAGSYSPPFGTWDETIQQSILQRISESGATCIWVGLGCPKQETWLASMRHRLPAALYFAVGAAFDFHAGTVRRAPLWIQKRGLEWLYRLCREPRRLFKRYFTYNSLFLWYTLTGRKHSPAATPPQPH